MGSTKMDTYVEPEIEEVPGPMDEDDIMMDDHIGCDQEEISLTGKFCRYPSPIWRFPEN